MALYIYEAFSKAGKRVSGTMDGSSTKQIRDQLVKDGFYVISVTSAELSARSTFSISSLFQKGVSTKEKLFFTKQLYVLLKAGVPILDALNLLIGQTTGKLHEIVISLRDGVQEGRSLAEGLAQYPNVFDTIYVQLVRAGEASGKLEIILNRLNDYLERQYELQARIRGALMLPIIQLFLIIGVVVVMLYAVVPKITGIFIEQKIELPFPTRVLTQLSDLFKSTYIYLIIIVIALYLAYRFWKATAKGARTLDALKLKLPIVKTFARSNAVVSFCRTLGLLLESGVNLAESLDIVCNVVSNRILVDTLKQAREQIIKQGRVAEYLKRTDLFPEMAIYLINTGEQSGALDAMLLAVAHHYGMELTEYTDGLVSKLNPVMLILMAVVVGFIVLAIMLPMINMAGALSAAR